MNAVEMKFGRVPHGFKILRQAAGFENRTGPGGFVKAPLQTDLKQINAELDKVSSLHVTRWKDKMLKNYLCLH